MMDGCMMNAGDQGGIREGPWYVSHEGCQQGLPGNLQKVPPRLSLPFLRGQVISSTKVPYVGDLMREKTSPHTSYPIFVPSRPVPFHSIYLYKAYTAYALFKAFEGLGTDEDRVTRILGGTDKKKMVAVNAYYKETYGKHLVEDLKEELNGTFLKARERKGKQSCVMTSKV